MLKLHQLFFRVSLFMATVALLIASIFSYFLVKNIEINNSIKLEKQILKTIVARGSLDSNYLTKVAKSLNIRITHILKNGKVVFDSKHDIKTMDNHANREEIIKLKNSDFASSIRYSHTLKKDLIYVATKVKDGFLRVAIMQEPVFKKIYLILLEIVALFAVLLGILIYFSNKISQKISKDSKEINDALEAILNKDFSIYLENIKCCLEFKNIAKKIQKVAKRLKKREKQKRKYTNRLKAITKRQSDIISAISHEFKNPVAAIIGYSQTLIESPNLNDSLKSKFLSKIKSNANKISNMIDTLALSIKLENQSIALNKTEFNLSDVIKSAKETLEQKYKERQIILECEDIKVLADRNMLENVFINLIENALKYSQDEVIIKCKKEKVEIIDKGIGIEQTDIKKIKEKFYRVDGISWNNSIGVGLYIVDYILKLHKLELEIKSKEGEGSVFGFRIDGILRN